MAETPPECIPEVLCAVLVRELLWLEARMDDQALLEGIVVFSDEDGPENERRAGLNFYMTTIKNDIKEKKKFYNQHLFVQKAETPQF